LAEEPITLKRSLGLLETTMIGVGATIGPTIFVVPVAAYMLAGPAAVISFILAGFLTLPSALNYAMMCSAIPRAGGGYSFVYRAYNGLFAFTAGWFMWIGGTAYASLSSYTFAITVYTILGFGDITYYALATLATFCTINYLGIKKAGRAEALLTFIVALILTGFVSFGVFHINWSNFEPFIPRGIFSPFIAIGYVYSIYIGFETIATVGEEIKNSRVIAPRAIILTIVSAIILFPVIMMIIVGVMSGESIVRSPEPLVDAANLVLGPYGKVAMLFSSVVASLATLNAAIIATTRIMFALSRDNYIPAIFMRLHKNFRTPYISIATTALVASTFLLITNVENMVYTTNFGYILGLLIINLSPLGLMRKGLLKFSRFKVPQPIIALIASLISVVMIPTLSVESLAIGATITLLGLVLVVSYRRYLAIKEDRNA
jgi:amino acid transporter